jgi:hypothetical protein
MKHLTRGTIAASVIFAFLLFGCSKSSEVNTSPALDNLPSPVLHNYGLLPMQPEQWSSVPVFTTEIIYNNARENGMPVTTLPSSYLLASPAIRDQGQIGSCTGFCGAESDEILNYYKSNNVSSTGLTVATGLSKATTTQYVNSSLFGSSSALSPLFLYYVERCVVNKQSISTDNGAYMVNIPETFQGLSNNSGSGTALTLSISGTNYSFSGDCYENLYSYPSNGSSSSTQYKTPPSTPAISNAPGFKIASQSGTTGSSGTTSHGYYVINSSDPVTDAKTAIANNKPVMMGFNVYDNSRYLYFEGLGVQGYAPSNYTYNPLTSSGSLVRGLRLLGGHAVPLIGYIDDSSQPGGGVFICENSWSTGWGYKGYFYLPYSVLRSKTIVASGNLYVAII